MLVQLLRNEMDSYQLSTAVKKFEVGLRFVFERILLCLPRMHLFNQKLSNIVEHYCNLFENFENNLKCSFIKMVI